MVKALINPSRNKRYLGISIALHAIVITFLSMLIIQEEPVDVPPSTQSVTVMLSDAASRCPVLSKITPKCLSSNASATPSVPPSSKPEQAIPHASTPLAVAAPQEHPQINATASHSVAAPAVNGSVPSAPSAPLHGGVKASEPLIKETPVSEASYNAAYLNNPKPIYPKVSKRLGEEGIVILKVRVMADGSAGSVSVLKSSEFERLDQSALEAVKQWKFVAAKRGDTPIESWVSVPITFKLAA